ncbi:MAG: DUF1015 domain-containing protein [Candidatus Omnitrophota bacterium]
MTQIKGFKAVYYDKEKAGDLSAVVCPPYDVISAKEQTEFYNASPHNFIRIDLGQEKSGDDRYDNKYTRARKTFDEWLAKGILKEDTKPCIYFYKQEYMVYGQKHSRMGFIALLRLPDEKDSKIYPHENTHLAAKEDRLRLVRNVKASLSSIFVCFSDKGKKVETTFNQKVVLTVPLIDIVDNDKVRHILWRLDDQMLINEIRDSLSEQQLFIADGHHRFEVAMEYRRQVLAKKSRPTGLEPCNFIMTYFTNIDSRDLLILPIHRIVKKIKGKLDFLEDYFRIDKISSKEDLQILLAKAGQNEHAFGFYSKNGIKLLRLKNKLLINQHMKEGSQDYKELDAAILKCFVFDRANISSDDIIYSKDIGESFNAVDNKQADACFILNPVRIWQLKAIALNGEKMPPKTTYFYPKVLSGLTTYRMDSK